METITYLNLKVEGTPISKVTALEIDHGMNGYGSATVTGEVSIAEGEAFSGRSDGSTKIRITTTAGGQPPVLFVGVVNRSSITKMAEYALLTVELKATASRLDIQKKNKSYQNLGSTYEEILNQSMEGKAILEMEVSDKAIGQLIMQYQETAWEFASRMASQFQTSICANVTSDKPVITIGVPKGKKSYALSDVEYVSATEGENAGSPSGTGISTMQYMELGDKVTSGGNGGQVGHLHASMKDGILRTTVYTSKKEQFAQKPQYNQTASGRMLKGKVQAVKKDKVQVHLVDIDESYDSSGNLWLPYSTAYSSSDGSGFYCMPQEGDEVRVFFPSDNEKDAFVASSVNVSPLDNPKHKKWRSPAGKEILMTEEGIFITCKGEKIFINLENENGITISSEKDINVVTENNMLLYAKKELTVQAENKILLSTGTAYIDMTPEEIQMGAENILIK
ncbi:MAG: hypothetical protein HDR22_11680 [Lachnospiraceae bacterium]|nr:hypothetical protein [Lachnospiraceae bacterium]